MCWSKLRCLRVSISRRRPPKHAHLSRQNVCVSTVLRRWRGCIVRAVCLRESPDVGIRASVYWFLTKNGWMWPWVKVLAWAVLVRPVCGHTRPLCIPSEFRFVLGDNQLKWPQMTVSMICPFGSNAHLFLRGLEQYVFLTQYSIHHCVHARPAKL